MSTESDTPRVRSIEQIKRDLNCGGIRAVSIHIRETNRLRNYLRKQAAAARAAVEKGKTK